MESEFLKSCSRNFQVLREIIEKVLENAKVVENPPENFLELEARKYSAPNNKGVLLFHSRIRKRLPGKTKIVFEEIGRKLVEKILDFAKKRRFYAVSFGIGKGFTEGALGIVSANYPHLALMLRRNFFSYKGDPEIVTLNIPEFPEPMILVDPEDKANILLGTDYYGEFKMSFLRIHMNAVRDSGLLGLHAGSVLCQADGMERGILIFGLSGTGKSTLTFSEFPGIRKIVYQDDIVVFDGKRAFGTEDNFYPKTDSVPELKTVLPAVFHEKAILENVFVDKGEPVLNKPDFCGNSRAIAVRRAVPLCTDGVDMHAVHFMIFLTRRPEMPALCRLTSPEQAVAYFMLGESIRTSAEEGKPAPVRVPGFDPFMLEPKSLNAKILLKFLKKGIEVFVMNTGYVKDRKVPKEHTISLLAKLVSDNIDWKRCEPLEVEVPKNDPFDPEKIFGKTYTIKIEKLRKERASFLQSLGLEELADFI